MPLGLPMTSIEATIRAVLPTAPRSATAGSGEVTLRLSATPEAILQAVQAQRSHGLGRGLGRGPDRPARGPVYRSRA